jgi:hypothetical protein
LPNQHPEHLKVTIIPENELIWLGDLNSMVISCLGKKIKKIWGYEREKQRLGAQGFIKIKV